ncbi:MAG: hypothetical protein HY747_08710 [Elusimicrobia bacterium]|nr:hypothetical protein [Elusimicrobiota bacterium]
MMLKIWAIFLFIGGPAAAETKFVPIANVSLLGGQSFFEKKHTSFDGNFALQFVPAVGFSDKSKLVPSLTSNYRAVFSVEELAGGGFLVQKIWENLGIVKWVYQMGEESPYFIKPKVSGKLAYYNETKGESIGTGLFDYQKFSGGIEFERKGSQFISQRLDLTYCDVRFPNYKALASQQYGTEIKSGSKVLDFNTADATYSFDWAMDKKTLTMAAFLGSWRNYPDQYIVKEAGTYDTRLRRDVYLLGSLGIYHGFGEFSLFGLGIEPVLSVAGSYASLDSDQNSYDAAKTFFSGGYYDYVETGVSPSLALLIGKTQRLGLGYTGQWRDYRNRLVQDKDGNYHDGTSSRPKETIRTIAHNLSLGYSWKFLERPWGSLSLTAQGTMRRSKSNMLYEVAYRYNYDSSYYFAGLTWDFAE